MPHATTDLQTALSNGYIGEVPIIPTAVANAVNVTLYGRQLWRGVVYYYGQRNAEMNELFGHTERGAPAFNSRTGL